MALKVPFLNDESKQMNLQCSPESRSLYSAVINWFPLEVTRACALEIVLKMNSLLNFLESIIFDVSSFIIFYLCSFMCLVPTQNWLFISKILLAQDPIFPWNFISTWWRELPHFVIFQLWRKKK